MRRKIKIMATVAIIALALPLYAQTVVEFPDEAGRFYGPSSNQRNATAGLFGTDVDNFMSTNFWSGVEFNNWFGFLHGRATGVTAQPFVVDLGYATRFGEDGFFLGTRYIGNIVSTNPRQVTSIVTPTYDLVSQQLVQTTTQTTTLQGWVNNTNQFEALFGIGDMGIKVGYFQSVARGTDPGHTTWTVDTLDGRLSHTGRVMEYDRVIAHRNPFVEWGMNLGEGRTTIRPYAALLLGFHQDRNVFRTATYETYNGILASARTETLVSGHSRGYFQPDITIGAMFDLLRANEEPGSMRFWGQYRINFRVHNNDFDAFGISGSAGGPVTWTGSTSFFQDSVTQTIFDRSTTLGFEDTTRVNQTLTLGYRFIAGPEDGFRIGFSAAAPMSLNIYNRDNYSETRTINTTTDHGAFGLVTETRTTARTNAGLVEETTFEFAPQLAIGATLPLIAGRFTVNAGFAARPFAFGNTVTRTSPNGPGGVTHTQTFVNGSLVNENINVTNPLPVADSVVSTRQWTGFQGNVTGGFGFAFNENMALDMSMSTPMRTLFINANDTMWLDVTTVNVLFTFRY